MRRGGREYPTFNKEHPMSKWNALRGNACGGDGWALGMDGMDCMDGMDMGCCVHIVHIVHIVH